MTRWRQWLARSWLLSVCHYRLRGMPIAGRPHDEVWYFAYGANMNDEAFLVRRGMKPLEWRVGRARGYRLRFNLDGRPIGKAAPANLCADTAGEVWACCIASRALRWSASIRPKACPGGAIGIYGSTSRTRPATRCAP